MKEQITELEFQVLMKILQMQYPNLYLLYRNQSFEKFTKDYHKQDGNRNSIFRLFDEWIGDVRESINEQQESEERE